jgi:hypothetical protein
MANHGEEDTAPEAKKMKLAENGTTSGKFFIASFPETTVVLLEHMELPTFVRVNKLSIYVYGGLSSSNN